MKMEELYKKQEWKIHINYRNKKKKKTEKEISIEQENWVG